MCEICGRNPCHPRCPNADPPKPTYICDNCGYGIYNGDKVYNIEDKHYCPTCAEFRCSEELIEDIFGEAEVIDEPEQEG